jgi:Pyruvate/2-oxoacid:ferredoxin oxidoreductase delta subunit
VDGRFLDCCMLSYSPMILPSDSPSEEPTFLIPINYPTNSPTQARLTPVSDDKPATKPFTDTISTPAPSAETTGGFGGQGGSVVPTTEVTVKGTFGCETGFVYCPGRSTCFTDVAGITPSDDSMWGWSIHYNASEGVVLDCDIYVGASTGCKLETATKVGTFTISKHLVHYSLDLDNYVSNSFQFYAGRCPVNDGGQQMIDSGKCDDELMSTFADQRDTYTLAYNSDTYQDTFAFDETVPCSELWNSVSETCDVFPVGSGNKTYMSASVTVCLVGKQPSASPSSSPNSNGPNAPAPQIPASKPVYQRVPTAPTAPSAPASTSTNLSPVFKPESLPTKKVPMLEPSNMYIPVGDPVVPCTEAYVYCPSRSVSFQDASFNNGIPAVPDSSTGNSCGWSIKYDYCDGVVDDCIIVTDLDDDCNPDSGTVIGSFYFGNDFLHYCIPNKDYVGVSFQAYVGTCEANDNGVQIYDDDNVCDPDIVATYARNYTSYPLISDTGYSRSFTFGENYVLPIEANNPWQGTKVLPMDLGTKYITAHACVVSADSMPL